MKKIILLLYGLSSMWMTAQKTVHKTVDATTISSVEINAIQIHKLIVTTSSKATAVEINAEMEGEYQNDLVINVQKNAGHFKIGTSFQPLFQHPNDKLSAHKVISISMQIILPENLSVTVSGHTINTEISGKYTTMKAMIKNGTFTISNFSGDGTIQSFNGAIFVNGYKGSIRPFSKYGKIFGKHIETQTSMLKLKTVNGNIYIDKPK